MKNKKMFCVVEPFKYIQTIHIFEDNIKIGTVTSSLTALANTFAECSRTYDINKIDITGSPQFCSKIINDTKTIAATQYNNYNLEINMI